MMTAFLVFLGLSSCVTLALVTAVVVGARRTAPVDGDMDVTVVTTRAHGEATFVPAYSR